MPGEQSTVNEAPSVAIGKTASSRKARQDSVSSMQTDDYVCISPSTPLSKAIESMSQDEGGCAIVCAEDGSVVGIFTERDLLTKIIGQEIDLNTPVRNLMLSRVSDLCLFEGRPQSLTPELLDLAWRNYFGSSHTFENLAPEVQSQSVSV